MEPCLHLLSTLSLHEVEQPSFLVNGSPVTFSGLNSFFLPDGTPLSVRAQDISPLPLDSEKMCFLLSSTQPLSFTSSTPGPRLGSSQRTPTPFPFLNFPGTNGTYILETTSISHPRSASFPFFAVDPEISRGAWLPFDNVIATCFSPGLNGVERTFDPYLLVACPSQSFVDAARTLESVYPMQPVKRFQFGKSVAYRGSRRVITGTGSLAPRIPDANSMNYNSALQNRFGALVRQAYDILQGQPGTCVCFLNLKTFAWDQIVCIPVTDILCLAPANFDQAHGFVVYTPTEKITFGSCFNTSLFEEVKHQIAQPAHLTIPLVIAPRSVTVETFTDLRFFSVLALARERRVVVTRGLHPNRSRLDVVRNEDNVMVVSYPDLPLSPDNLQLFSLTNTSFLAAQRDFVPTEHNDVPRFLIYHLSLEKEKILNVIEVLYAFSVNLFVNNRTVVMSLHAMFNRNTRRSYPLMVSLDNNELPLTRTSVLDTSYVVALRAP